ncbi:hypothetical protein [Mesonia aestuariivivens]|uniref:Chromosome partitioning protein ParA n=1 Tax=Mesonia aestuariivivens TaxID=2796128 RepID=A0ABS6W237_9FLAO|nr:hypothetical protein [Mesonia aestuariivivens]MBW2961923.1 hypothetical protein [Mesonia aestuariivivens]
MSEKNKENILKILIGVLLCGLAIMIIYTVNFHREKNENIKYLEEEKAYLKSELLEIQTAYDSLEVENILINKSLSHEKRRILVLLDSLQSLESNYNLLKKYRLQADQLKIAKHRLLTHLSALTEENKKLKTAIDSTNQVLRNNKQKTDSLHLKNEELQQRIDEASIIKISEVHGEGAYVKKNGELKITDHLNRIEQIRICFQINESKIVPAETLQLFIQVINPSHNLIGDKKREMFHNKELYYSQDLTVNYHQSNLQLCEFVSINKNHKEKGEYIVNIFKNEQLLSSSTFIIE